jgi:hypothetical protein
MVVLFWVCAPCIGSVSTFGRTYCFHLPSDWNYKAGCWSEGQKSSVCNYRLFRGLKKNFCHQWFEGDGELWRVVTACDRTRREHRMDNFVSWYHICLSCGWNHMEQQSGSNTVKSELLVFEFKVTQNYKLVLDSSSCTSCRENERDQFAYYDYKLQEFF